MISTLIVVTFRLHEAQLIKHVTPTAVRERERERETERQREKPKRVISN